MENFPVDVEIDKLTNSVENRITGDSFDTRVIEVTEKDLSKLSANWNFDWNEE